MDKFFLVQIKRTNNVVEKGVVVKETLDAVLQSYHAYLGAYAYDHDANTDYVMCEVLDGTGGRLEFALWNKPIVVAE